MLLKDYEKMMSGGTAGPGIYTPAKRPVPEEPPRTKIAKLQEALEAQKTLILRLMDTKSDSSF